MKLGLNPNAPLLVSSQMALWVMLEAVKWKDQHADENLN